MKKLILPLLLLLTIQVNAQFVVSDPAVEALMGSLVSMQSASQATQSNELAEATQTTITVKKSVETLKKTYEIYSKVSDGLKTLSVIKDFFALEVKILQNMKNGEKKYSSYKNISPEELLLIKEFYIGINKKILNELEVIKLGLSQDSKMTTGERVQLIIDSGARLSKYGIAMNYFNNKMISALDKKEMSYKESTFNSLEYFKF